MLPLLIISQKLLSLQPYFRLWSHLRDRSKHASGHLRGLTSNNVNLKAIEDDSRFIKQIQNTETSRRSNQSGQIIATSQDLNEALYFNLFQEHLGCWNIMIWPDQPSINAGLQNSVKQCADPIQHWTLTYYDRLCVYHPWIREQVWTSPVMSSPIIFPWPHGPRQEGILPEELIYKPVPRAKAWGVETQVVPTNREAQVFQIKPV